MDSKVAEILLLAALISMTCGTKIKIGGDKPTHYNRINITHVKWGDGVIEWSKENEKKGLEPPNLLKSDEKFQEKPPGEEGKPPSSGGKPPASGGKTPASGGKPPASGRKPPSSGGKPPASGGIPPASGGKPPAPGGNPPASGGNPPASGGNPPASGGNPSASGGNPPASGGKPPSSGGKCRRHQQTGGKAPIDLIPPILIKPPKKPKPPKVPKFANDETSSSEDDSEECGCVDTRSSNGILLPIPVLTSNEMGVPFQRQLVQNTDEPGPSFGWIPIENYIPRRRYPSRIGYRPPGRPTFAPQRPFEMGSGGRGYSGACSCGKDVGEIEYDKCGDPIRPMECMRSRDMKHRSGEFSYMDHYPRQAKKKTRCSDDCDEDNDYEDVDC